MSKEVVFYGERGILNSIILDTQGNIAKQKQLLRSIVLADRSKLNWVDDVYLVRYFVEPNFDEFGNADVIIEAIARNSEKYVLFVEIKINSYEYSALTMEPIKEMDNEYFPKSYRNNCDKLNIKLAILYRFIQAFKSNLSDDNNIITKIQEQYDVRHTYNDKIERKLENRTILNYWYERFADTKEYYFIALTNDSHEILEGNNLKSDLFPFNNKNMLPPIGKVQWEEDKNKFGIITYETLLNKNIISKDEGYYEDVSELMLFNPPTLAAYNKERKISTSVSINKDKWGESQEILYNLLKDINVLDMDLKSFLKEFIESIEQK